jgi:hypothetical protein
LALDASKASSRGSRISVDSFTQEDFFKGT